MAHRPYQFALHSGLRASRLVAFGPTHGHAPVSKDHAAGQLGLSSTSIPIHSTEGFSEPLPEGVLSNLLTLLTFPWAYCLSPCGGQTPWAGSPGFPAFVGIRLVGFPAHRLWTHLRSWSPFPGYTPLADLRLTSARFPVRSPYGFPEPLLEEVPSNLSKPPAFPRAYCSSPCRNKAPWAGSPGFPAFAGIRFVGLPTHRL